MLAGRTVAGLKKISYTHVENRKNMFIKGRESVDDMSFDLNPQNNGDQVTNCLYIVMNKRFDINSSEIIFHSICGLLYDVISIFCLSYLPFLGMLLY
jgi:hypothetical protein